jgi:hypothetical protein
VLDAVDVGTSYLIAAEARADFTMATATLTAAAIVEEPGLPDRVRIARCALWVRPLSARVLQRCCASGCAWGSR